MLNNDIFNDLIFFYHFRQNKKNILKIFVAVQDVAHEQRDNKHGRVI